ncbi:uncharacterized protein LOC114530556 isoform X2 [Dendronephthya gigantea]|uniref:uncharacterized protein LOC114530556 isoform X2 n=1 Tax=Dendronephthya gigantea TaxID=151771 RepID=UPI00106C74E0|nr:uncharacterized protein LOC114530556 isoform X2 [Dendronephthya gigantea]
MASKRKPLDDARKRVKEKLNAIDEQKEFIQNSVHQLTNGVKLAANSLLTECNKTKFFQKYRAVSQELEKCLDDLLLISATISSLEEDDENSGESEEDDKPPDDHPLTSCHEGEDSVKNISKPKHEETFYKSPGSGDTEIKSCFSAVSQEKETDMGHGNESTFKRTKDFTFSKESEMKDLIDFEQKTFENCKNEAVSPTSYSSPSGQSDTLSTSEQTEKYGIPSDTSLSIAECDDIREHVAEAFDLVHFDQDQTSTSTTSQFSTDVLQIKKFVVNDGAEYSGTQDINQPRLCNSLSSTTYVNDPCLPSSLLNTSKETVENSSRRDSSVEENKMVPDLSSENMFVEFADLPKCSSPTTVRLQPIGFCEYKSQEIMDGVETAMKNANTKMTVDESENNEIKFDRSDKAKITDTEESKIVTDLNGKISATINDSCKSEPSIETHKNNELPLLTEKTATNAMQESLVTSNRYKSDDEPVDEPVSSQESESSASTHDKVQHEVTSPVSVSAGDVLEGVLREKPTCEISEIKGLQIPAFEIQAGSCIEVTVKEVISPRDFWIQKANDDLDLLMEKMCYYFSKRAKSGDKGGLKEAPLVGHVCCGRYTVDNVWYRALVTAVSQENCVTVLYVDEGNSETLPLSRLRELDEKFAGLPCQALRVQLKGLELSEDITLCEVNDWFKRRVSGETLEAVLCENEADVKPVPLDLYIFPPNRSASDVNYQKIECSILEMLIRQGFAIRASSVASPGTSDDIGPPSSPSDQGIKSESVRSSSLTSGFHDTPSPTFDDSHSESSPSISKNGVICRVPPPHIPVDSDGSLYMLVSHIVSPEEFYVHIISNEAGMLDDLMTDMNQTYQDLESKDSDIFSPCVGDFCCARFSADGNWYRGLVLQVRCFGDSSEKVTTVEVFYIDFGNIEQVTVGDVKELLPQFMSIPAQAIRCSLADVNPSIKQADLDSDVFKTAFTAEQDEDSKNMRSRRRVRRHRKSRSREITIAAGDEDSGDEILTGDMDVLGLIPEIERHNHKDRLRSSISDEIAMSYQEPSLFSDTAVELFEKVLSGVEAVTLKPSWSERATDYFRSLTKNARKLVGYVVPWDSATLNNITNYSRTGECSLPNLGPVLKLNLYDISNENDCFINAEMVKAEYASSNSIKGFPIVSSIPDEASIPVTENTNNGFDSKAPDLDDIPVVRVLQSELSSYETPSDSRLKSPLPLDPSSPSSPTSPTTQLLDAWSPSTHDFKSFRNAYSVQTDNLDVAITGYEENRGKICRFYHTRYGCYRGSTCPDKHIEQDVSEKVIIYGSTANPPKLPDIGAWVLVKITAIYNPAHFWVQLPFGIENLSTQRIQSQSGKKTSGEENLKDFNNLMKEMSEFYSKMFRRERSLVPPTEGELVALRSGQDNRWYRGQVCQEGVEKYKILFVDYGIADWVDRSNICPIMPQFLHLPFQSIECCLANITPKSENWTEDSRQHFKSLVEDKVLVCQILSIGMNKKMIVNLYESDKGDKK